jgi:hypothetical protein
MVKRPGPGWKAGWEWIGNIQVTVEVKNKIVNFSDVQSMNSKNKVKEVPASKMVNLGYQNEEE